MIRSFESVTALSLCGNKLERFQSPLPLKTITKLHLERNAITSLAALAPLSQLKHLDSLFLRDNCIRSVRDEPKKNTDERADAFQLATVTYVDLAYNEIDSWGFIDALPTVFPALTGLRISHNPLYEGKNGVFTMGVDEGYMLTTGRLRTLKTLNFSTVYILATGMVVILISRS